MVFSDQHEILPYVQYSQSHTYLKYFSCTNCCSSADEEEDPDTKAAREKERRQANNARERWVEEQTRKRCHRGLFTVLGQ